MFRDGLLRWIAWWVIVSFAPLVVAHAAQAAPCTLPKTNVQAVHEGLGRLARPPVSAAQSRWWAALPVSIRWRWRDVTTEGAGWYHNPDTGLATQRGAWAVGGGWSVTARWDLRPLFWPQPAKMPPRYRQMAVVQRLAAQAAKVLQEIAKLRLQAALLPEDGPRCVALRQQAVALWLAVAQLAPTTRAGTSASSAPPPDVLRARLPAALPPRDPGRRR